MSDLFGESLELDTKNSLVNQVKEVFKSGIKLEQNLKVQDLAAQIKWIGTHHKKEYLDELLALKEHKSVLIRRECLKVIANFGGKTILPSLQNWQAIESDRQTLLLVNSTIDKLTRQTGELLRDVDTFQVSEFLITIKQLIGSKNFKIEGEIAEINIYHQVVYFALKDKDSGERLDCMAYYNILDRLDFTLNEGLSILVTGKASLAKNSSKLRLNVSFIQLTGEGEFLRNLKLLQIKLEKEGLFDVERKRKLTSIPKKIALLVSKGSAAESDFLKVLAERRGGLDICLVPIKTQGDSALKILLNALDFVKGDILNPFSELFGVQTVVITRGGGSKDDLIIFNQEQIVRAIYALPVPSLVAIGHEKDWSLAEMSADQRASTPTQAAIMLSLSRLEIQSEVDQKMLKINLWMNQKYESYKTYTQKQHNNINRYILYKINQIEIVVNSFKNLSSDLINTYEARLNKIYLNILFIFKAKISEQTKILDSVLLIGFRLKNLFEQNINQVDNTIYKIKDRINFDLNNFIQNSKTLSQEIALYNPKQALKRGYAMITTVKSSENSNTKVIENWKDFKGTKIEILLQDGSKTAQIIN